MHDVYRGGSPEPTQAPAAHEETIAEATEEAEPAEGAGRSHGSSASLDATGGAAEEGAPPGASSPEPEGSAPRLDANSPTLQGHKPETPGGSWRVNDEDREEDQGRD